MKALKLDDTYLLVINDSKSYILDNDGCWYRKYDKIFLYTRILEEGVEYNNTAELFPKFLRWCIESNNEIDLKKNGGDWIGAARSWIQSNVQNGSNLTWGSDDICPHMTVRKIEDLATRVAEASIREFITKYLIP
jgi:hypothetical protein